MYNNGQPNGSAERLDETSSAVTKTGHILNQGSMGRRSFMKRLGVAGAAALPVGALLATKTSARGAGGGGLNRGDTAILRLLAAAEVLETDLWQQYKELALGNPAFQAALLPLDGDMPTYVNQNTRDEFSHQDFLNHYLMSKGQKPVDLSPFLRLPSSQAVGSNKSAKRLTSLMNLNVDTSWFLRYRSMGNPDFGDSFAQIVNLNNVPGIPNGDLPLPTDPGGFQIQFIANVAGFHFATIEQGGASLYTSLLARASSLEVLRIVASIGGTEIMHFQTWQDKAGNAPLVQDDHGNVLFPQLPIAPPPSPNGTDPASPNDTNQIMPAPCTFISKHLPLCSIIRPTADQNAGPKAAFAGFAAMGLFQGQKDDFFDFIGELVEEADEAQREA